MYYQIEFKWTVEEYYTTVIEANSEEEAREIFNENPFGYVNEGVPYDKQGLDIEINEINEVE